MGAKIGFVNIKMGGSCMKLFLLCILGALYFTGTEAAPPSGGYEVCETETCKDLADEFLSSMDPAIDPCKDFYKYACGNWAQSHPPVAHAAMWSHFGIIANRTNSRLKEILETGYIDGESISVRKAKQIYRACMDVQTIENRGVTAIHNLLDAQGGWPMIMNPLPWQFSHLSWQTIESSYNLFMASSPIFTLVVVPDATSSNKNILTLAPPSARPPPVAVASNPNTFFNNPIVKNYKTYIKTVAKVLARTKGITIPEAQLDWDAQGIVLFETYLASIQAAIHNPANTTPDISKLQKKMTIKELQAFYDAAQPRTPKGQINWLSRIKHLFSEKKTIQIDNSEEIIVLGIEYFQHLVDLIENTDERAIINTIHWWFVKQTIGHTNQEMNSIIQQFAQGGPLGAGPAVPIPRWMKCTRENELKHALSYAYVQKYFPDTAKETALDMVHQIAAEMEKEINKAKWMDDDSKKAAKEKIDYMTKLIGFPEWYKQPPNLDKRFEKLAIGAFYLENSLLVKKFTLHQQLDSLRKPVDRNNWVAAPVEINAFYSPIANSLTFPAAILQRPFFDARSPDYINYGGIGAVIGHEISHGFDNIGSQFDKYGNVAQWWSSNTRKEFEQRAQCFVDQFNRYKVTIGNMTFADLGSHTLGENIADSTGMRAVFHAFLTHKKEVNGKDIRLPGLEHLTQEKLFFLSYAESLCQAVKPELLIANLLTDPHSANPLRVIGTLSNLQGFADTFECPANTVMNPAKKCGIWY